MSASANEVNESVERLAKETKTTKEEVIAITKKAKEIEDVKTRAECCRDNVIPVMEHLRELADEAEIVTATKYWPFPTYGELLFSF